MAARVSTPSSIQQQQKKLLTASEPARAHLRDSLLTYLRATYSAQDEAITSLTSYERWAAPPPSASHPASSAESCDVLIGDRASLMASLQSFANNCNLLARACHSQDHHLIYTHMGAKDWMIQLTKPASSFDTPQGRERVLDLLALRSACACASSPETSPASDTRADSQRHAAFELAQELPFFDRDITSFYLEPGPDTPEYMLHVAHSILSLSPSITTLTDLTSSLLPVWREQGLLHVLAVAVAHLPKISDWLAQAPHVQCPDDCEGRVLRGLDLFLSPTNKKSSNPRINNPISPKKLSDFVSVMEDYYESPFTQAVIMLPLDQLATCMGVKSNATLNNPMAHSLELSLKSFPSQDQCSLSGDSLPLLWATIKPMLEQALPPSLLLPQILSENNKSTPANFW